MEVVVYANIKGEEVDAKTVEVVVYANIREEEDNAKTVEVVVDANIRDEEVNVRIVLTSSITILSIHKCQNKLSRSSKLPR